MLSVICYAVSYFYCDAESHYAECCNFIGAMILSITKFSIMTLSVMTLSITTLSIMAIIATQHKLHSAKYYAECYIFTCVIA